MVNENVGVTGSGHWATCLSGRLLVQLILAYLLVVIDY